MQMHAINNSSILRSYGYEKMKADDAFGLLALEFADGGTYYYAKVPERVFEEFLLSDSRGSFARRRIIGNYDCVKGDT